MKILGKGTYMGSSIDSLAYNNIIVSKTEYNQKGDQGWHCHENPFFAYILKGGNIEMRNMEKINCTAGTLLFYHAEELHCNKDYASESRIFHVEIDKNWGLENDLHLENIRLDKVYDPIAKNIFVQVINEFSIRDELSESSIQNLVLYLFNLLTRTTDCKKLTPSWKHNLDKILHQVLTNGPSLTDIAKKLNIHPVTLSREFPKYYHCTFGEYVRQLRIEKSLPLLAKKSMPISAIAEQIGFSDPGNFARSFKRQKGISPDAYRKML